MARRPGEFLPVFLVAPRSSQWLKLKYRGQWLSWRGKTWEDGGPGGTTAYGPGQHGGDATAGWSGGHVLTAVTVVGSGTGFHITGSGVVVTVTIMRAVITEDVDAAGGW